MNKILLCLCMVWLAIISPALGQTDILQQKVSVNTNARPLSEVLKELSAKYGFNFSYSKDLVALQQKVTVNAVQRSLKKILDELFTDTRIRYVLIGNQIVLQKDKTRSREVLLTGYITDISTGEALAGATITDGKTGTSSNSYGFYSFTHHSGPFELVVSYLGYDPLVLLVPTILKDTLLSIQLKPRINELVEVKVNSETNITDLQQMNKVSMTSTELRSLPRLMGEADAIKAFQMMPGVLAGREGSSDLIVRGGSPDQNLILLDGVPVYNVSHLLGLFSVFNPDAIRKVDMIKGGFPAPYGGRLSSVVDIYLKEGNNQHFAAEGSLGLISSKLLVEGPLNDKTSFIISGRRTYLDLVTAIMGQNNNSYNFHDLNAKINHTFSAKDRLYLSVYSGLDKFVYRDKPDREQQFKMRWGNTTGSLRWNHIYGRKLFSNVTLTHSLYNFRQRSSFEGRANGLNVNREVNFNSSINDWGAKADFDYAANNTHNMRFGSSYIYHTFNPESVSLKADSINFKSSSFTKRGAQEIYAYADDRIRISENLEAVAGVHWSGFAVKGKTYTSLQPRLALNYAFNPGLSLRTSYATMAQYLHLLSNTTTGSPTDVWAPVTDKVKPQRSWQATLGGVVSAIQNQFELSLDLYYKELKDVSEFKDGGDFVGEFLRSGPDTKFASLITKPYEERITNGIGWTYGSEWMIRKRVGRTSGWLGYTISYARRQLDGINNNKPYPYTYDSRHSVALVVNHQLSKRLSIGGSWSFRSGYVTTLPTSSYKTYSEPIEYNPYSGISPNANYVDDLSERNNFRMPSYHRMDLSLTHVKKKKWGERSWNISIYNAYNRQNPYYLEMTQSFTGQSFIRSVSQVSLLPILPSFSYGFKF